VQYVKHMPQPEPGTIANQLWTESIQIADQSLHNPFVRALGDGSLPKELFKAYIAEDCYYLDVFAKAFRIALGKSEGLPPDVSTLLIELHDGIAEELKLHKGYERETARSMDLDLEERQAKCQATKAYTDFLLHTAETENVAGIIAAMTPCFRLYYYIGCKLATEFPSHNHDFSAWIKTYSGAEAMDQSVKIETLLNLLAPGEDYGRQ